MENFPVIGVCGPSQSGKDLVGDWFCEKQGFQKVAFADPLKRLTRAIFNCDFETLWGNPKLREKQMTYSEEEWLTFLTNFSQVANPFLNEVVPSGLRVTAYLSLNEWLHDMKRLHTETGHLTFRVILQTLGTEWGRKKVDPLLWANYLYDKVAFTLAEGVTMYQQDIGLHHKDVGKPGPVPKGIIITDTRFLNEIHETKRRGGFNIRLRRLAKEAEFKNDNVGVAGHQSEVEMRDIPDSEFDRVLELEEGRDKVYAALEKLFQEKPWAKKTASQPEASSTTSGGVEESTTPTA